MFFGTVVKPGKSQPLVPHQDGFALHLSQASLAADVKGGTRASLLVKLGAEGEKIVLCTLCAGSQDTVLLDQFMTEYAELSVQGSVPVHLTGYYSPEYGPDGGEEEDEDEEYGVPGHPMDLMGLNMHHPAAMQAGGSSDEEEDSEEGESDEGSEDEGESEDEFESDDSEDLMAAAGRGSRRQGKEPSVIIEDITDQENAKAAAKAGLANGDASKKRKAAAAALPAPGADGAAAAKKQAVAAGPKQQQQQQQKAQTKEQPKQQQQQQQQKTPADKQQQKQQKQQPQKQEQQTPPSKPAAASPAAQPVSTGKKSVRVFENGFEIHNTKMGDPHGKLAKGGKTVKVRYVGRLKNGKVFDKSDKKPFAFRLGVGEVIKGWDRGVEGMRVGDKRKLVIPPQMGYGAQKTGPIPANSWLEFDVELLDVK